MAEYVKNERIILDRLQYEGIVRLDFTFQDANSLCEAGTGDPGGWGHKETVANANVSRPLVLSK